MPKALNETFGIWDIGDLGATDPDTTANSLPQDSLGYSLVKPLSDANNPIAYNQPYNHKEPFAFKGNAVNLPPPFGFHFNKRTGILEFTPTKVQVSVLKVRVKEYRKTSGGSRVQIGQVDRDVQVFVTNCAANSGPEIKGMACQQNQNIKRVCEGNLVKTNFCTNDPDPKDSVTLSFNKGSLPGSPSFTIQNPKAKYQKGKLKWLVPAGSASAVPYRFVVSAQDDNCPKPEKVSETFKIKVKPSPKKPNYSVQALGCGEYRIATSAPGKQAKTETFINNKRYKKDTFTVDLEQPNQSYPLKVTSKLKGCSKAIMDTIRTDSIMSVKLGNDTTVCYGSSVTLNANVVFNEGPVSYTWQDSVKNMLQRTFSNLKQDTVIWVKAQDNNCTVTDRLRIKVDSFSRKLNALRDTSICTVGDTLMVKDPYPGSDYRWSTGATADSVIITDTGDYFVTATNNKGCSGTDSFNVDKRLSANLLGANDTFCKGEVLTLTAQPGNPNATYQWNTNQNTQQINVDTGGMYVVKASADSSCSVTDSVNIKQVPKASVTLQADTSICDGDSVQLSADPGYQSYSWSTGDTTRQIWVSGPGQFAVTVSNGVCTGTDTVGIQQLKTPSVSLRNDTSICATDSVQLSAPAGYSDYSWSNGDTSRSIWVNKQKQYTVTVTAASGCSNKDSVSLTTLNDCVWPGDANNDGVANNQDILDIGVKYNTSGKTRNNQGTQWDAYKSSDWSDTFNSGLNTKFADCDGDGMVQTSDTLAVSQNYNQTHNKRGLEGNLEDGGTPLSLVLKQDNLEPGDQAEVMVKLGEQGNEAQNFYGIAANLRFSGKLIKVNQLRVSGQGTWLQSGDSNFITFGKRFNQTSRIELAGTRTDQQGVSGQGTALKLILPIKADTKGDTLQVSIQGEYLIGPKGEPITYDTGRTAIQQSIEEQNTGLTDADQLSHHIQAYPNPASTELRIKVDQIQVKQCEILNPQGQVVKRVNLNKGGNSINVKPLPAGPYHLMIRTNEGLAHQTVVVR